MNGIGSAGTVDMWKQNTTFPIPFRIYSLYANHHMQNGKLRTHVSLNLIYISASICRHDYLKKHTHIALCFIRKIICMTGYLHAYEHVISECSILRGCIYSFRYTSFLLESHSFFGLMCFVKHLGISEWAHALMLQNPCTQKYFFFIKC